MPLVKVMLQQLVVAVLSLPVAWWQNIYLSVSGLQTVSAFVSFPFAVLEVSKPFCFLKAIDTHSS